MLPYLKPMTDIRVPDFVVYSGRGLYLSKSLDSEIFPFSVPFELLERSNVIYKLDWMDYLPRG
jgi:hypothetical protein